MEKQKKEISSFQENLTLWVFGCMVIGVLIGRFLPTIL